VDVNLQKDKIQNEAVAKWTANDKKGTTEIITGLGKTFLALKALYTMPKNQQDTVHLFLAEQKDRQQDLIKDVVKFNAIYKCNVMADYNLQFQCYQTVRNWKGYKLGLVIADEVHDSMSVENYKFYINNSYNSLLGLTALFNGDTTYFIGDRPELEEIFGKRLITKQDLLDHVAPICYTYTVDQGQIEGTSRKLNIFVVETELDPVTKNVECGSKTHTFMSTETLAYEYAAKKVNLALNMKQGLLEDYYKYNESKNLNLFRASAKRCKLLYNLPSKIKTTQSILKFLVDKTVVFSNSLDALTEVTPWVVSSKKTDTQNESVRTMFDCGTIKTIGSFKKLKQGANLEKADNCILMSYYSTEIDFVQRIGRLRQHMDKVGNVFVLVTKNTQEEVWLSKMMENATQYNIFKGNLTDCLIKYKDPDA
jgi:superfamily II DNA or RNA helicase